MTLVPTVTDVRQKGQVWTPKWVADVMAAYIVDGNIADVLDPAVGPGALLAAVRDAIDQPLTAIAFEIDAAVLGSSHTDSTFDASDVKNLRIENFLEANDPFQASGVIANPPYLRHHLIGQELKKRCQEITNEILGIRIDARAGLHVYFLIKALGHLREGGRLAFLLPADTFEGIFAEPLWTAVSEKFRVDGILTFSPEMAAFPGVDTNAVVVFIEKSQPKSQMFWMRWSGLESASLVKNFRLARLDKKAKSYDGLEVHSVQVVDAIRKGFTRSQTDADTQGLPLTSLAKVVRGIATGDNNYFAMTSNPIKERGLSFDYFVRRIARVRDMSVSVLTESHLDDLDAQGRPTYLLSLDKSSIIDQSMESYLQEGVASGVSDGALVRARGTWYYMEKRSPVPILFAYLGRRSNRFIETQCEVQPLTGFLCVYPFAHIDSSRLLKALNDDLTISELAKVGKSYGDGAIKVEPGGLRKLVVPFAALFNAGFSKQEVDALANP